MKNQNYYVLIDRMYKAAIFITGCLVAMLATAYTWL